jgi:hypothetical protein
MPGFFEIVSKILGASVPGTTVSRTFWMIVSVYLRVAFSMKNLRQVKALNDDIVLMKLRAKDDNTRMAEFRIDKYEILSLRNDGVKYRIISNYLSLCRFVEQSHWCYVFTLAELKYTGTVGVQHSATKDAYLISFRQYKRDYTCILYRLADIEDIEYSEGTRVHPLGYCPLSYANQVMAQSPQCTALLCQRALKFFNSIFLHRLQLINPLKRRRYYIKLPNGSRCLLH